jgi:hypothetical protein
MKAFAAGTAPTVMSLNMSTILKSIMTATKTEVLIDSYMITGTDRRLEQRERPSSDQGRKKNSGNTRTMQIQRYRELIIYMILWIPDGLRRDALMKLVLKRIDIETKLINH